VSRTVRLPDPLPIRPPADGPHAVIVPPGSKSLTNRLYLLAALSAGRCRLSRPLRADDTDRFLAALETLGVAVARDEDAVVIDGTDGRFPRGGAVDLGDGGTPARFMLAAACLAARPVVVDGSPRMRERPVAELVGLLRALGGRLDYTGRDGALPVRVEPSGAFGRIGRLAVGATESSQFLSALLLIAPQLPRGLDLELRSPPTSPSYVELTVAALADWGVAVQADGSRLRVPAQESIEPRDAAVPPDASSAVYFWSAAALLPGAEVRTPGVAGGPRQPDLAFVDVLRHLGAEARIDGDDVVVRYAGPLRPEGPIDMSRQPDAAVCLGALAALAERPVEIRGLRTLRVKESDRIAALASELRKLGCRVQSGVESIVIDPRRRNDDPVTIETHNDHRMAMAFAILGLARPGISIADPTCVAKSHPGFWGQLEKLTANS
jgi:3-phosphoshikimate 1-carboxyvinyltransferase